RRGRSNSRIAHCRRGCAPGSSGKQGCRSAMSNNYILLPTGIAAAPDSTSSRSAIWARRASSSARASTRRTGAAGLPVFPGVFELMPETFTLLQLQRCVEALTGRLVHKQNFRRLIGQQDLVEETRETTPNTGGRPAKLFRFRREVLTRRAIAGTKLPVSRA